MVCSDINTQMHARDIERYGKFRTEMMDSVKRAGKGYIHRWLSVGVLYDQLIPVSQIKLLHRHQSSPNCSLWETWWTDRSRLYRSRKLEQLPKIQISNPFPHLRAGPEQALAVVHVVVWMVWGIPVHGRERGLVFAVEDVEGALLLGRANHGLADQKN